MTTFLEVGHDSIALFQLGKSVVDDVATKVLWLIEKPKQLTFRLALH